MSEDQAMPLQAVVIPVTPLQQNCSLFWCTKTMKGAFVDPGGEMDKLLAAAKDENVTIERILVTHGHSDHAGNVAAIARDLNVPVEGPHEDDLFWIERIPDSGKRYGIDRAEAFIPDRWLKNGDTVTVGELTLGVHHCPGHTPGHVVFHHPESKLAFVGDVLFQGSIGRCDLPRGNQRDLLVSIRDRLWPLGSDVTFVPGHGPLSTFGHERRSNPFVADQVLARMPL